MRTQEESERTPLEVVLKVKIEYLVARLKTPLTPENFLRLHLHSYLELLTQDVIRGTPKLDSFKHCSAIRLITHWYGSLSLAG